jgi:hypothetical protein
MTGRATFGDCAQAATRHLGEPALRPSDLIRPNPASMTGVVQDYNYGLHRVIKTMTRYLSGPVTGTQTPVGPGNAAAIRWLRASAEAREAAQAAMGYSPLLSPDGRVRLQLGAATSHVTLHLDSAASAMAAGRDLLLTHFATGTDGSLQPRSGWVPVIESAPVSQALLITVAGWARQIVAEGTYLSSSPALRGESGAAERTRLLGICDRLSVIVSAVDAAQHEYPVPDDAAAQLQAIPGNFLQPQRIPARTETVSGLCRGLAESAERVRHAFMTAIPDAAWSPAASAESFSRTAVYATAISHHCQILQQTLAARAADLGDRQLCQQLTASAATSARASKAWLRAAHRWYHVKTDAISETSPASAEAADLMIWTGRLAHADPDWTPAFGPSHDARAPHDLAPEASDISSVITAVHEASTTLTSIAVADYERIRAAAQTGRLLVPAIQSANGDHAGCLFVKASKKQGESLLGAYGQAGTASVATVLSLGTSW